MRKLRQIATILVIIGIIIFFLNKGLVKEILSENNNDPLVEAMYYSKLSNSKVQCLLCPKKCILKDGQRGFCNVRINRGGKLYSLVYGRPVKPWILPINKTPLLLAASGYKVLIVSTAGCNMRCHFCLTWQLSQAKPEEIQSTNLTPEDIINQAVKNNCNVIVYTSNEPTVFYEYMLDIAKLAREKEIINVLSTSGYINPEPLRQLCRYMDYISLGIKGFSDKFYNKYCSGELKPILEAIRVISEEKIDLEVVYVVIPTLNDDIEQIRQLATYVKDNLGEDVPFYFYRYKPSFKLKHLPLTPIETLMTAQKTAKEAGLNNVFIHEPNINNPELDETIYCPKCNKLLVRRRGGIHILVNNIQNGKCKFCGQDIPLIWWLKHGQAGQMGFEDFKVPAPKSPTK